MDLEHEVMELIANSGYARSLVFQAIRCACEERDFAQAETYMQQAQEALSSAHHDTLMRSRSLFNLLTTHHCFSQNCVKSGLIAFSGLFKPCQNIGINSD